MTEYPLSYGQRALWFVHQLDRSSAAYNVHIAFRIHSPLDVDALRSAFQTIVDRHAPLRSTLVERGGVLFQSVADSMEVAFSVHDARDLDATTLHRRLLEPLDRPRPAVQTFRGRSRRFLINKSIHTALRLLARQEKISQFAVLVAAFQAFLHRLTGQREVLVGAPTAARTQPEWDALVGYFVNPVVLHADFGDDATFRELCRRASTAVIGAIEHQDFPFSLLVERLQPARDPARSPLFQAMISFERPPRADVRDSPAFVFGDEPVRRVLGQLEIEPIVLPNEGAQFDLTLAVRESAANLFATLEYNTDLFDDSTIERWI